MRDVNKSRTVIARRAGTVSSISDAVDASTRRLAGSGSHGSIESSSRSLQSSTRITADRGNGLRERRNAKDRIALHGAERFHVRVVVLADDRDEAGDELPLDVSGQHAVHPIEPRGVHLRSTQIVINATAVGMAKITA
jgi:hypothetical protein